MIAESAGVRLIHDDLLNRPYRLPAGVGDVEPVGVGEVAYSHSHLTHRLPGSGGAHAGARAMT